MSIMRRYLAPESILFLACWLILLAAGQSRFLRDPGTLWHPVVGQRILTDGFLDYDVYSYTRSGQEWVPHQWLGEVVMAWLQRVDGYSTLLLAAVTVLAGLYTWIAGRLIRVGVHWSVAAALMVLTIAASSSNFHIRPHIASFVLLGITQAWLCDVEAGRKPLLALAWLVPLYVLWSNLHGGVLGGIATLGLTMAGWTVYRLAGQPSPIQDGRRFVLAAAIGLACIASMLVNPYGLDTVREWLALMGSDALSRLIVEHGPLDPFKPDGALVLLLGLVYLVVLAGTWPRWPRVTWLLPLVWLYLATTRIRHAPLFAVMAMVTLADLFPQTRWAAWLARTRPDMYQPPGEPARCDWRAAVLPACAVLLALLLQATRVPAPVVGHDWARLDTALWPVELEPVLRQHQGKGTPIFNQYAYGPFLMRSAPGFRVFVDDRCELYGPQWLEDLIRANRDDTAGYLERMQHDNGPFHYALVRADSGFALYFQAAGWRELGRTSTAVFFTNKQP